MARNNASCFPFSRCPVDRVLLASSVSFAELNLNNTTRRPPVCIVQVRDAFVQFAVKTALVNSLFTWSVFFDAASARPSASPARASAESAFSAAALIFGRRLQLFLGVLRLLFHFVDLGGDGVGLLATYFFVAQPPNSNNTPSDRYSMTRFIGNPPFELSCSLGIGMTSWGRAEAGWFHFANYRLTWIGSQAIPQIYCKFFRTCYYREPPAAPYRSRFLAVIVHRFRKNTPAGSSPTKRKISSVSVDIHSQAPFYHA